MAWNPSPRAGGAADEFLAETQSAGWSLWSFTAPDTTAAVCCSIKQEQEHRDAGPSGEEQSAAPFDEGPWFPLAADDISLSQLFSDEEMRSMFPDSVDTLVASYEDMLTGVLTGGAEEQGDHAKQLDRDGAVETRGLQNGSRDAGQNGDTEMPDAGPSSEEEQAGLQSVMKRSRAAVTGADSVTPGFEAMVLEELEDVVFQLTRRTRIRYRDAFYRLAESSRACDSSSQQPDGNASSRNLPAPGCPERETNPIDRMVTVLTMMEAPGRQLCDDSGAEAQTATCWAA